jgi:hypothetical protein
MLKVDLARFIGLLWAFVKLNQAPQTLKGKPRRKIISDPSELSFLAHQDVSSTQIRAPSAPRIITVHMRKYADPINRGVRG